MLTTLFFIPLIGALSLMSYIIGSLFMLLSIITILILTGTTDSQNLYTIDFSTDVLKLLFIGFFITFIVKIPLIPENSSLESPQNNLNSINFSKSLIWVYNINLQTLVENAPFISKSACAKALNINRHTVASYLDKDKILNHKWLFSSSPIEIENLSKWLINSTVWEALVGDLLGDGYISKPSNTGSSRIEFTFSAQNLPYLNYLKFNIYKNICNSTDPTPYPNPISSGEEATQYWFSSLTLPTLGVLHSTWYKNVEGKYIKILPDPIESILTPIGIAYWIQGDGY